MEIITPDIINLMNQTEPNDNFDLLWDSVLDKFDDHNKTIKEDCVSSISKFIDSHILTNCPVFSRSSNLQVEEYGFVIGKPEQKNILFLSYDIVGEVKQLTHTGPAFSEDEEVVWLYDEFHKKDSCYEHHIIFSDGVEWIIPFQSFQVRQTGWFED